MSVLFQHKPPALAFAAVCPVSVRIYKWKLRQPEQSHVTAVKTSLFVHRWTFVLYESKNSTNCTVVTLQLYTRAQLESNLFPRLGLASLHSTYGSTWQGHTVNPFLPMEFPKFGHWRGVTPCRVFQPATKPPGIWWSTCSWRRVVDLPSTTEAYNGSCTYSNHMLTCADTMRKNTVSFCAQLEKTKTNYKYKTHYRGKAAIYL